MPQDSSTNRITVKDYMRHADRTGINRFVEMSYEIHRPVEKSRERDRHLGDVCACLKLKVLNATCY